MSKMVIIGASDETENKVTNAASATRGISVVGSARDFLAGLQLYQNMAADYLLADISIADYARKSPQWPRVLKTLRNIAIRLVLISPNPISERGHTDFFTIFHTVESDTKKASRESAFAKFSRELSELGICVMQVEAENLDIAITPAPGRRSGAAKTGAVSRGRVVGESPVETLKDRLIRRQSHRRKDAAESVQPSHQFSVDDITDFVLNPERLNPELKQRIQSEADQNEALSRQIKSLESKRPFLIGRHTTLFDV